MTVYQSTVGSLAAPPDSLTIPEFLLDNPFLQPNPSDPTKPDWVCLIDDLTGRQVRFSEVSLRDTFLASRLPTPYSYAPGQDIFLLPYYPVCSWAAHRLGATVAPMNPAMTTTELAHQLKLSNPSLIFVQNECTSLVKDAAKHADLTGYSTVVVGSHSEYPTVESLVADGKNLPPFSQPALAPGEAKTRVAFLCFSSGTTGLPKETSAHVYDPQVKWENKRFRPGGVSSGDTSQMTLVVTAKFNFEKMLDNIARYRITDLFIVPPQAVLLSKHPAVTQYDISSVRSCTMAAAPVSAELTQSLLRIFPHIHLGQGYGMTETCAGVTMYPISPKVGVLGSGGKLLPGTTAKVVKADGTLASAGDRGELYIQGPQVTLGYYQNPTATNETFIDGWIRTGDEVLEHCIWQRMDVNQLFQVYFDEDGNLFIVDRIKELIKVKGFQVAPAELEGHLLGHDDVADTAVIGVPDDFSGELPRAFVVLKPHIASKVKSDPQVRKQVQERIFKHVSTTKSPYKWLTGGIEFVDIIPKSPSGKILRRVLRDQSAVVPRAKL
ncbi:phenylacetyl-CoA ligase [Mycena latifolia]|nr:phenylacetyl-CoA ligase [Mycena latifolia]